jgi:PAS domain S-box-containing protein
LHAPLRVLIVEDLPEQAELVAHELTNAGFVLAWSIASDLKGCRSAIEQGVDLVVADCNTVHIDLPALMALLGELSDPPPVVSLSTDDSEEVTRECLRNGASAFLHKFRLDEIGELARGLVETRGPRRAAAISSGLTDPRSFAENACDLIAELSCDGRLLYVNPSLETCLGYAAKELAGRRVFEFVHPDHLPRALESLREAIETGSASRGAHRVRRRDGSWRWLESTGNPYRTADGERRVIVISRDVTERFERVEEPGDVTPERRPERDLRMVQPLEDLGPLLGEIADGLNSLLTLIATEAESVERQLDPSSWLRREMGRIIDAVDRGTALVRRLLAFSTALPGETQISDPSKVAPEEAGPETILLVEDDDRLRSVVRETLEEEGYAVLQAASGEEALERTANHAGPIHLMLSEGVMPGIDGQELAQRLGASRPRTRVILMSDFAGDGAEPLPKGMRPADFLRKPFTLAALRAKLREILEEDPDRLESG